MNASFIVVTETFKLFRLLSGLSPKRVDQSVGSKREDNDNVAHSDNRSQVDPLSELSDQDQLNTKPQTSTTMHDQIEVVTNEIQKQTCGSGNEQNQANLQVSKDETSLTAIDHKNAGNKLCSLSRYDEALVHYSKAISINPEVAIFFSNRALCHLKLQQWSSAIHDCRRALELDNNLIKAHFFLAQALSETSSYDEALKHLQLAHELAKERNMNFGDDIAYQIRLIKRHRWIKIEEETEQSEDELHNYVVELIKQDRESKLREVRSTQGEASGSGGIWQQTATTSSVQSGLEIGVMDNLEQDAKLKCDNYIAKLNNIFSNLRLHRKNRDVPDYLCGKISFEIMHDPVITPSGITYDRRDIEEHLKRVGQFDPITRQPLVASQLVSNLAMKEVVDAYLNENEWALYY